MSNINTWALLLDRLLRQHLKDCEDQRIILKENDTKIPLVLKYDDNGKNFWFIRKEDNNV